MCKDSEGTLKKASISKNATQTSRSLKAAVGLSVTRGALKRRKSDLKGLRAFLLHVLTETTSAF